MRLLIRLFKNIDLFCYSLYTAYKKIQARQYHKLTGRQYHVVPSSNHRLKVVNNDFIKFYNKQVKGTKYKKNNIHDLLKMSVYTVGKSA